MTFTDGAVAGAAVGSLKDPVCLIDSDSEDEDRKVVAKAAAVASESSQPSLKAPNYSKVPTASSAAVSTLKSQRQQACNPVILLASDSEDEEQKVPTKPAVASTDTATSSTSASAAKSQMQEARDAARKRWVKSQANDEKPIAKRPRTDSSTTASFSLAPSTPSPLLPIKVFATTQDRAKRSACPATQRYSRTLREMLGFDGPERLNSTVNFLVLFNYLVDFNYLINTIPELLTIPKVLVFYATGDPYGWIQASRQLTGKCNAEFVQLNPSDPANSRTNPLSFRVPFGVHHTKMFLVGLSNGTLRTVIHTSNLLERDNNNKANAAWIQDFPSKIEDHNNSCDFEKDLVQYLQSYRFDNPIQWNPSSPKKRTLCDQLKRYDFSAAKAILIASTPGKHKSYDKGYIKLKKAIRTNIPKRCNSSSSPIICQFSSLGSLNDKWLKVIAEAWDVSQAPCTALTTDRLKLIFPTVQEIRDSMEGYVGGGSVPGPQKNTSKPFLQPLYHKWCSNSSANPLHKPGNVPHIKQFYQLTPDSKKMEWYCLTSHNLSKAAWGERQNASDGTVYTRHWELGVFVCPQLFGTEYKLVPATASSSVGPMDLEVPIPHDLVPTRHAASDKVWSWDMQYAVPDRFGRTSIQG